MLNVFIRFNSALIGALAAFFLSAHLLHHAGLMGAEAIWRVNAFYAHICKPVTSLDPVVQKTLLVLSAALVGQAILILVLFRRWDRPAKLGDYAIEHAEREIPERLREYHDESDDAEDTVPYQPMKRTAVAGAGFRVVRAGQKI